MIKRIYETKNKYIFQNIIKIINEILTNNYFNNSILIEFEKDADIWFLNETNIANKIINELGESRIENLFRNKIEIIHKNYYMIYIKYNYIESELMIKIEHL